MIVKGNESIFSIICYGCNLNHEHDWCFYVLKSYSCLSEEMTYSYKAKCLHLSELNVVRFLYD